MTSRINIFALLLATVAFSAPALAEKPDLPMPSQYVQDYANVISASDKTTLLGVLQELEQKTGAQYIVLTVKTTEGLPIEEFSIKLGEKWKLGQKGRDNGFLFTIATNDRKYRFEVGRGLEGDVTDASCGQMGRDILVPYLKRGDYSGGIRAVNLAVASRIAQGYGVKLTGVPIPYQGRNGHTPSQVILMAAMVFGVIVFVLIVTVKGGISYNLPHTYRRDGRGFYMPGSWGGTGGFGGGFGGGGGGGGFGGFGGGGGGSFGGGGASGSW